MSTTHSVSKKVEVLVTDDGTLFYAMFEGTFESNVYPKEPHVSCSGFGAVDDIMLRVFQFASSCEGGMLKGTGSSYIKPESYIRQWRKALANPQRMKNCTIRLPLGSGWRDIKPDLEPKVRALMDKYGFADRTIFNLEEPKACELLSDLIHEVGISPWKLLSESYGQDEPGLGHNITKKSKPAPIAVEIFKCRDLRYPNSSDLDHMFRIVDKGGPLVNSGWPFQVMSNFINNAIVDAEKKNPGCAEYLIGVFRKQLESASFMSDEPAAPVPSMNQQQFELLETASS